VLGAALTCWPVLAFGLTAPGYAGEHNHAFVWIQVPGRGAQRRFGHAFLDKARPPPDLDRAQWRVGLRRGLGAAEDALADALAAMKSAEGAFDAASDRFDAAERALDAACEQRSAARRDRYTARQAYERPARPPVGSPGACVTSPSA